MGVLTVHVSSKQVHFARYRHGGCFMLCTGTKQDSQSAARTRWLSQTGPLWFQWTCSLDTYLVAGCNWFDLTPYKLLVRYLRLLVTWVVSCTFHGRIYYLPLLHLGGGGGGEGNTKNGKKKLKN